MKKSWLAVLACTLVTLTAAAQEGDAGALKGRMLTASNGARLGQVFRVNADGSVQMIIGGKLVSVGLFGGGATFALPLIPIKAVTIQGS